MKTIIISLVLLLSICSCSTETEYDSKDPKYLINVNFATGIVKEGGVKLQSANNQSLELCLKVKAGLPLPEGYSSKVLCIGSDGLNTGFMYIQIADSIGLNYYLLTFNESTALVHFPINYLQVNCLNRWILVEMNKS